MGDPYSQAVLKKVTLSQVLSNSNVGDQPLHLGSDLGGILSIDNDSLGLDKPQIVLKKLSGQTADILQVIDGATTYTILDKDRNLFPATVRVDHTYQVLQGRYGYAPALDIYPNLADQFCYVSLIPRGSPTSARSQLSIWNTDYLSNSTDWQRLNIKANVTQYEIQIEKGGALSVLPLVFLVGTDEYFRLDVTNQRVKFSKSIEIVNAGTGANPIISSNAGDQRLKVSGIIETTQDLRFYVNSAYAGILTHSNTAHRTYTFPDADGTVALTGASQNVDFNVMTASRSIEFTPPKTDKLGDSFSRITTLSPTYQPGDVYVTPDFTKIFYAGYVLSTGGAYVGYFDLTRPFDWSSATETVIDVSSETGTNIYITGICFSPDGKKMWIGAGHTTIYEYDLSTAFDPTTRTLVGSYSITHRGITISDDGTKMITGNSTTIIEYTLTEKFTLSGGYTQTDSYTLSHNCVGMDADGFHLLVGASGSNNLSIYRLSAYYDLTSLALLKTTDFAINTNSVYGAKSRDRFLFITIQGSTVIYIYEISKNSYGLLLTETNDAKTPSANQCLVFSKDNGLGKTQLVVKWSDGTETVLATQP